jgi:predicted ATPase
MRQTMRLLETLSLKGFRSIKELENFKLGPITVLVGANGSGKSNLIGFFRMMNCVMQGGLQRFLQDGGGASNFLHFGPARTPIVEAALSFNTGAGVVNTYSFKLKFAAVDRLIIFQEYSLSKLDQEDSHQSLRIENNQPAESALGRDLIPESRVQQFIKRFLHNIRVFHFHDTSMTSSMRRNCDAADNLSLRAEGGNVAAVLLRLREEFPAHYRRIVAGVNTVFPELNDFELVPTAGNGTSLLLRWHPASNPAETFGPAHLSDGTLRMIALVTLFNLPEPMSPWMIILDEPELGLHPAAEACLASLIRSASTQTQVILGTQSATLVDHFKPSEVVVTEMHEGVSTFRRLEDEKLSQWLKRYTLGEAWRKNVFGGRPE